MAGPQRERGPTPLQEAAWLRGPAEASVLIQWIGVRQGSKISALDVGCRVGELLVALRRQCSGFFVGIDSQESVLEEARDYAKDTFGTEHNILFQLQDAAALDPDSTQWRSIKQQTVDGEGFDFIFFTHMLEYFNDIQTPRVLRCLERLLRPGGRMAIQRERSPRLLDGFLWGIIDHENREEPRLIGSDQFAPPSFHDEAVEQLHDFVSTYLPRLEHSVVSRVSQGFPGILGSALSSDRSSIGYGSAQVSWATRVHDLIANGMKRTEPINDPAFRLAPEEYEQRLEGNTEAAMSNIRHLRTICREELLNFVKSWEQRHRPFDTSEELKCNDLYIEAFAFLTKPRAITYATKPGN